MRVTTLEKSKDAAYQHHMSKARELTQKRYGQRHKELLDALVLDSGGDGGLRSLPFAYHVGYLGLHKQGLKDAEFPAKSPVPRISTMGGILDKKCADWNYEEMSSRFENGELLLIEARTCGLISDVFIVHLPTLVEAMQNPDDHRLLPLARAAMKELRGGGIGRKRMHIDLAADEEDATASPEASPERPGKRPRLAPAPAPAPAEDRPEEDENVEVLMHSDAMELDGPAPLRESAPPAVVGYPASASTMAFAEKFAKIIDVEHVTNTVAYQQFTVDAAWANDIDNLLIDHLPTIFAITTALMLQPQLVDIVKRTALEANQIQAKASEIYLNNSHKGVHISDAVTLAKYHKRLLDAYDVVCADVQERMRAVQHYQDAHPLIAGRVAIFFERATPASLEEQNKLLATAYHLVRTKGQLQASLNILPRCSETGCTHIVHPRFGEPCCKHRCLYHRTPEHIGHVGYCGTTREAATPAPLVATMREAATPAPSAAPPPQSPSPLEHEDIDAASASLFVPMPLPEFDADAIAEADSFLNLE